MKLTFLGTGAGIPAKQRNVSSLALHLMNKEGSIWLFDCGEATQHQILHTPIKLRKIEKIFISHLHGDHIYGLPGLLGSRSFQGAETPLIVYGPVGIKDFIETSLKVSGTYIRYSLTIEEIEHNKTLYDDADIKVDTAQLDHGLPSFGFRVQQKDLPGPLLMEKVKEENIPIGPILQQLKEGLDVELEDGRVIHGIDYVGPPKKGNVVTILGDTRYTNSAIELAREANILVHEATFAGIETSLAYDFFHSTTLQAAEVARRSGVNQLILNHISSRYQLEDMSQFLSEAQEIFPDSFIAEDLATFDVSK